MRERGNIFKGHVDAVATRLSPLVCLGFIDLRAHGQGAEIAYATGFSSQPHMTANFSKQFGTPPWAYRKAVRE